MALLDCLGSVMARGTCSNCLYRFDNRHVFEPLHSMISTHQHKPNLASRGIVAYYTAFGHIENMPPQALYLENIVNWAVLYSSLILATLLWCTILIVYRILRVGGAAGRMHVYQRLIEMLVESALLYSAVIIVVLVFEIRNEVTAAYVQELAIVMRVRLVHFHFYFSHKYNVPSRASCLQFWLVALQQGMHAQTIPGAKASRVHHFDSEVFQVRRTTTKQVSDLDRRHLHAQHLTWKRDSRTIHRIRAGVAAQTCNAHGYSGVVESVECGIV